MTSAWQFIKAKRTFLLCVATLLGLMFCAILLLTSRRTPFQVFAIATNEAAGTQWVQVVVSNTSSRTYSILASKEVLVDETWWESPVERSEYDAQGSMLRKEALRYFEDQLLHGVSWSQSWDKGALRKGEWLAVRFPLPTEPSRWRLRLRCIRNPSQWESRIARWCTTTGLRYPFKMYSEHTFEFDK